MEVSLSLHEHQLDVQPFCIIAVVAVAVLMLTNSFVMEKPSREETLSSQCGAFENMLRTKIRTACPAVHFPKASLRKRRMMFFLAVWTSVFLPTLAVTVEEVISEDGSTTKPHQHCETQRASAIHHPKLAVCTVDGNVLVLNAHDGELVSFFSSGVPLVGPSEPLSVDQDRRIVPGLDGRLYVSSEDGLLNSLEITVMDVLSNPVKTCKSTKSDTRTETEDDNISPPMPLAASECGIVTATKSTSLFALDSASGNLVWQQHPNGTTSTTLSDRTADHTVILQREDVLLQQISTLSGNTVWNVTLGTLLALDFGDGLAANIDLPPPSQGLLPSASTGRHRNLLLEEYLDDLPHVMFNEDGTGLSAVDPDNNAKLWSRTFPTVVASVFGLQGRTWEPLTVLDENDEEDIDVQNGSNRRLLPESSHELAHYRSPFSSMDSMYQRLVYGMDRQKATTPLFQSPASIKREFERGATSHDLSHSASSVLGDYYHRPQLALPSPELLDTKSRRRASLYFYESGIYFSWQILIAAIVLVLVLAIFVGRFIYKKKKKLWIKRATVSFDLNLITNKRSISDGSVDDNRIASTAKSKNLKQLIRSHSLPGKMDGFSDPPLLLKNSPAFKPIVVSTSPHELALSTPDKVPLGAAEGVAGKPRTITRSLTETSSSRGVGLIDGRFPLLQYSRYASEFEEISPLGSGGFGSVFRVRNTLDGRNYAVKKIHIRRTSKLSEAEFSRRLNKILREVKALALLDHPNIVRYFNAWLEIDTGEGDHSKTNAGSEYYLEDDAASGEHKTITNGSEESCSSSDYQRRSSWGRSGNDYTMSQVYGVPDALDDFGFVFDRSDEDGDQPGKTTPNFSESKTNSSFLLHTSNNIGISFQASASRNEESSTGWSKESQNLPIAQQGESTQAETKESSLLEKPTSVRYILYIQMQYCSQKTLADFLSNADARKNSHAISNTAVDIPHALTLFLGIMQGVEHVHSQGLIHRDLKPNNCFIDDTGAVKVGDFGLSRNSSDNSTADSAEVALVDSSVFDNRDITAGVGTRSYASPEQMKGGSEYDSSTDIFSLGIILFELCYPMTTGMERNIVLSNLRKHIFPELWMNTVCAEFPDLHNLLTSMISNEPKDRPTAQTIVKALHSILDGFTISSLDHHSHEGAILLRVETHPRVDVLQYTMELVIKSAQPVLVDIVQYGLRGVSNNGEMKSIMEFAVMPRESDKETHCMSTLGNALVSKLSEDKGIIVARQVLGSKQQYCK